jgi:hypothetical protein
MGLYGGSKATYNSPGDQAMLGAMQQQAARRAAMQQQASPEMLDRKQQANTAFEEERRRAMRQQEQRTAFEEERSRAMQQQEQRGVPEMRSGIDFGPGRANRAPEQGSPEYNQLLQSVRNRRRGLGRR